MSEEPTPKVPDEQKVNNSVPGNEENKVLDPNVEEELEGEFPEDPFLTEYGMMGNGEGDEKVDVTSSWIGEKEDWKTKTKLSAEQIIAMTQVRMVPSMFEELEDIEGELLQMVENMEKYAVSHKGMAREQHVSVLRAMHSGEMHDDSDKRNALLSALAVNPNQEDE